MDYLTNHRNSIEGLRQWRRQEYLWIEAVTEEIIQNYRLPTLDLLQYEAQVDNATVDDYVADELPKRPLKLIDDMEV